MTRHWTRIATENKGTVSLAATVTLLDQLRTDPPGLAALEFLSQIVPVDYLSLVEYARGQPRQMGISTPTSAFGLVARMYCANSLPSGW